MKTSRAKLQEGTPAGRIQAVANMAIELRAVGAQTAGKQASGSSQSATANMRSLLPQGDGGA